MAEYAYSGKTATITSGTFLCEEKSCILILGGEKGTIRMIPITSLIADLGIPKNESIKHGNKNGNPTRQTENNMKIAAVSFAKGMHRENSDSRMASEEVQV